MKHFKVRRRDDVWDALHVDTRLIGADHHDPRIRQAVEVSYDFWGIGSKLQAYPGGTYSKYCEFPLAGMQTAEEIEAYNWPTIAELSFETLRAKWAAYPDKAIIAHITHAPYFKATHMRGMEAFMEDLALNPEIAEAIIRKITDYLFPALEKLCVEAKDDFDIF